MAAPVKGGGLQAWLGWLEGGCLGTRWLKSATGGRVLRQGKRLYDASKRMTPRNCPPHFVSYDDVGAIWSAVPAASDVNRPIKRAWTVLGGHVFGPLWGPNQPPLNQAQPPCLGHIRSISDASNPTASWEPHAHHAFTVHPVSSTVPRARRPETAAWRGRAPATRPAARRFPGLFRRGAGPRGWRAQQTAQRHG